MSNEFFYFDNIVRQDRPITAFETSLLSLKNENSDSYYTKLVNGLNIGQISKYPRISFVKQKFIEQITNFHTPVFGFGSDGLLRDLFFTLNYKSIQMLEFSYKMASVYNQLLNKEIRINKFAFKDSEFSLKEKIVDLGGDILYLVNPHCPTGFTLTAEDIKTLSPHFKHIIIDEAYTNPFKINWDMFDISNVIIVKSFSKLGGVPGLRLGYCLASDKTVINHLEKMAGLYEMSSPAAHYLEWLLGNAHCMQLMELNLRAGFDVLTEYSTFALMCGNFALLQPSSRFMGPRYTIDGEMFTRVTLTDKEHAKELILS